MTLLTQLDWETYLAQHLKEIISMAMVMFDQCPPPPQLDSDTGEWDYSGILRFMSDIYDMGTDENNLSIQNFPGWEPTCILLENSYLVENDQDDL